MEYSLYNTKYTLLHFPITDILHKYVTFIVINEAMLIYYYYVKPMLYSDFLFMFQDPNQDIALHLVVVSS